MKLTITLGERTIHVEYDWQRSVQVDADRNPLLTKHSESLKLEGNITPQERTVILTFCRNFVAQ